MPARATRPNYVFGNQIGSFLRSWKPMRVFELMPWSHRDSVSKNGHFLRFRCRESAFLIVRRTESHSSKTWEYEISRTSQPSARSHATLRRSRSQSARSEWNSAPWVSRINPRPRTKSTRNRPIGTCIVWWILACVSRNRTIDSSGDSGTPDRIRTIRALAAGIALSTDSQSDFVSARMCSR